MDRKRAIDKAKHLAALAADKGTPLNEARNAGVKLAKLVVTHGLLEGQPVGASVADAAERVKHAAGDVANNEQVRATARTVTEAAEATATVVSAVADLVAKVRRKR